MASRREEGASAEVTYFAENRSPFVSSTFFLPLSSEQPGRTQVDIPIFGSSHHWMKNQAAITSKKINRSFIVSPLFFCFRGHPRTVPGRLALCAFPWIPGGKTFPHAASFFFFVAKPTGVLRLLPFRMILPDEEGHRQFQTTLALSISPSSFVFMGFVFPHR